MRVVSSGDALGEECAPSLFEQFHAAFIPPLLFFISTPAVSVALGTAMTTSQSNILVQMEVF